MKLLDKLVLKDLVPQFFIGVGMFASLYFALGPLLAASRFISDGFSVPLVAKYMAFSILPILGLTFPMGILLAVLLGYGRLSGDSETVALFAGGIPFLRVAVPAAVLGLIVSVVGYIVNDPLASYANRQILDMKESAFHQVGESNKPFDLTIPFPGNENATQATLHIEEGFSLSARTMRNVTIVVYDANRQPSKIIHARSAHPLNNDIKSPAYTLQDVDINGCGDNLFHAHLPVMSTQDLKIEALAKP
ncbi:MAG: LptF/LptG family permease, partial [Armatimonadota bacterium]|nr:LptF/LptG family permease [Armatimonadota bacterium]